MAAPVSYAVDVSDNQPSHQPWTSFGVHMGIAKASEGQHSHDAWFGRHLADIRKAGLVPGAYHFAWPNQDVTLEAANYASAVRPVNSSDLVHILDLEPYPNGAKNYTGRSDAQIRAWADRWVALVKKAFPGQRVLAYTPRDAYTRHFPEGADGYWYPAYPVQNRSFATAAKLARPMVAGHQVWGWQFASVPRDQTVIYMSPADLRAWAAGTTITPQQEDGMADWKTPLTIKKGPWSEKDYTAPADFWLMLANIKAGRAQAAAEEALAQARANGSALTSLSGKVGAANLTDAQVAAVADRLASNPAFVTALAGAIGKDLAARMQA
jgi:GH25 family lysozyme M1 (1,4-beta-N-acetylmuramidase)